MQDKIQAALQEGYSPAEVLDFLSSQQGFDAKVTEARSAGYGDEEILSFLSSAPAAAPEAPDRTWTEAATDKAALFGSGTGKAMTGAAEAVRASDDGPAFAGPLGVALAPLVRKARGLLGIDGVEEQIAPALEETGKRTTEYWDAQKSDARKAETAQSQARIQQAEQEGGQGSAAWQAIKESAADPEMLVEQIPNLAIMAALSRIGGAPLGVAGGAALQGGDVASGTREALNRLTIEDFHQNSLEFQRLVQGGMPEAEARARVTDNKVQESFAVAGAVSVAANTLIPGGMAIEKALAGNALAGATLKDVGLAVLKGSFGEAASEATEEGLGQIASNERVSQISPTQPLLEGSGAAAGQGAVMGFAMGGGTNVVSGVDGLRTARQIDATTGLEFADAGIDAAARAQLDPALARMGLRQQADAAQSAISGAQSAADAVDAFSAAAEATSTDLNLGTLETGRLAGEGAAARNAETAIDPLDAELLALEQEAAALDLPTIAAGIEVEQRPTGTLEVRGERVKELLKAVVPDAPVSMRADGSALVSARFAGPVLEVVAAARTSPTYDQVRRMSGLTETAPNVPTTQQVAQEAQEARGQEGAQETRDDLIARYAQAEPFSDEEAALSDRLKDATRAEVSAKISAGEMPVFETGRDTFATVTPSTQQPGMLQVTRYNRSGVMGDSQYRSVDDALAGEFFHQKRMIPQAEAEQRFAEALQAEAEYQARTQQPTQAPAAPIQTAPAQPPADAGVSVSAPVAPQMSASGNPFKTERAAAASAKQRKLDMVPVAVDGGWGLAPRRPDIPADMIAPNPAPAQAKPADTPVLQNRDRSTPSSIAQMQSIASNPDYGRLGFSRDFANGAPVVAGGAVPAASRGRQDVAVAADGRRIPVQYAVVEAADVLPSNQADGTPNADYGNQSVQRIRAIAGNGRIAGLQRAYASGTTARYVEELAADTALHGVAPEVVRGMRNPVLVRVMPAGQVTADIGDVSNTVGNLNLSAVEQASNDARRVDLDALQFAEDGGVTAEAVRQFVRAMPQAEQGGLIDTNGQPTRQAFDRISAAVFAKAYGNDQLVRLFAQAQDAEARNVMSALAQVAPKMARLEGAGALDIRSIVAQAAEIAVNARRNGIPLSRAAQQMDMAADPDVAAVLELFAENARTVRPVVEALGRAADFAYSEATKPGEDMFGAVPRASRQGVINQLRSQNERASQEPLENAAGRQSAGQDAQGRGTDPAGRAAPAEAEGGRSAQADAAEGLTLDTYTNADIAQREAEQQERSDAEAKAERDAASKQRQEEERAEVRRRSEAAADTFELGGDAMENLTGQGGLFAEQAPSGYIGRKQDTQTTDLFGDPYANIETRPGTTERQRVTGRAALAAAERVFGPVGLRGADRSILGSAISEYFRADGGTSLVGQRVSSAADLAALAQVLRDPRFETFRVFYTDDAGVIVGEAAYSSRLPAAVYLPMDFLPSIVRDKARFGATRFWVMHNHPSGRATPSEPDRALTRHIGSLAGFDGHVVIDYNEYAAMDANGDGNVTAAPQLASIDLTANPEVEHALLGKSINGPADAARIAKTLQVKDGFAVIVATNAPGDVQLLVEVPASDLIAPKTPAEQRRALARIRRAVRETGAGGLLFVVVPGDIRSPGYSWLRKVSGQVFTDVLDTSGRTLVSTYPDASPGRLPESRRQRSGLRVAEENGETERAYGGREAYERAKAAGRTKLNYRQWVQVRTPAFKAWFGNSKVVDAETGEPMVVYHGTNADFTEFDGDKAGSSWDMGKLGKGFYFSTDPRLASSYATNARAKTRDDAPQVMPAYVALQNPIEIGPLDWRKGENVWGALRDLSAQFGVKQDPVSDPESNQPNPEWSAPFRDAALAAGFDGVVLRFSDGSREVVAFRPEQIKSTGNNGNFDGQNPDIRRSFAGQNARTAPALTRESLVQAISTQFPSLTGAVESALRRGDEGKAGGVVVVERAEDLAGTFASKTGRSMAEAQDALQNSIRAWHGSPYRFDRFSASNIGTGEGAQAYGWGLYFADSREVAEYYQRALSGVDARKRKSLGSLDGVEYPALGATERLALQWLKQWGSAESAINAALNNGYTKAEPHVAILQQIADGKRKAVMKTGALYEVSIAPAEDAFLLWDKPLSEQSAKVRSALEAFGGATTLDEVLTGKSIPELLAWVDGFDRNNSFDEMLYEDPSLTADDVREAIKASYDPEEMADYLGSEGFVGDRTGESIYRELSSKLGGDQAASAALADAGVRGIKYLDGASRSVSGGEIVRAWEEKGKWFARVKTESRGGAGGGFSTPTTQFTTSKPYATEGEAMAWAESAVGKSSSNYVVFDDADVEIVDVKFSQNGDIQGFHDPKSGLTFLVGSALTAEAAPAVLLHEATHAKQRTDIDARALALIDARAEAVKPVREFLGRVAQRMDDAGEAGNATEASAYIVEEAVLAGRQAGFSAIDGKLMSWIDRKLGKRVGDIVRDFVAMVRAWAQRAGVMLNPSIDDLVAIAKLNLRDMARGDVTGQAGQGRSAMKDIDANIRRGLDFSRAGQSRTPPAAVFSSPALPNSRSKKALDKVVYQFQDRFTDLKAIQASIEAAGRTIRDEFNPYMAETLMHGKAAYRVQTFLEREIEPAMGLMRRAQINIEDLDKYLHARHAAERNAKMAERNPNQAELDRLIQDAADAVMDAEQAVQADPMDGRAQTRLIRAQDKLAATQAAKPWSGTEEDRQKLSGMSNDEAQQILDRAHAGMKATAYRRLGEAMDRITAQTRAEMAGYGLESGEAVTAMDDAYAHYVPLKRDMEESELLDSMGGTGQGLSIRGSQVKRATGSLRNVENIFANVVAQREATIVRGEKNRVAKALYGLVMEHPNPELFTVIRPGLSEKKLRAELQSMGLDPDTVEAMVKAPTQATIDEKTGLAVRRVNANYGRLENAVVLRVNGEDRVILFNKGSDTAVRLVRALRNDDSDFGGLTKGIMEHVGPVTRYLSAINTQYNPIFGLTNFSRDVQGAMLNLQTTELADHKKAVARNIPAAIKGIWNWERGDRQNPWASIYEEFLADGGATGYRDQYANLENRAKAIVRELGQTGLRNAKGIKQTLDLLSDYNTAIENATRLAAYKAARDAGMSRARAADLAKDVTVNFNRKGARSGAMASLYAFFNSAAQGTERTLRVLNSPAGRKILAGGVALGALQAVLGILALGDDWDEIPEFERAKHLIIPLLGTDGKYIKIPMPLGFHAIPNVGRSLVEMAFYRDRLGERGLNLLGTTIDAFNPLGASSLLEAVAPSVADPFIQVAKNENAFGRKIEREDFSSLSPTPGWTRAKEETSSVFKALAYGANWITSGGDPYEVGLVSPTPEMLSYMTGVVTGGLGREADKIISFAEGAARGDSMPAYKIPIVSRFYGEAGGESVLRGKYYDAIKEINAADFAKKRIEKAGGDPTEYAPLASLASLSRRLQNQISDRNKERQAADDKATRTELEAEILSLQQQLVQAHASVLDAR